MKVLVSAYDVSLKILMWLLRKSEVAHDPVSKDVCTMKKLDYIWLIN